VLGQHLRLPQLARSVDTRKPALANAMLDQPYDALATRAFERVDLVVSGDGLDCDGNAFHAACEAALLRFAVEFTSILHQRTGHSQLLFLLELDESRADFVGRRCARANGWCQDARGQQSSDFHIFKNPQ
jgi:hypothetical protein